jgi:hypothetical protein
MPSITAILPAYNEWPQGSVVLRAKSHADRPPGRRQLGPHGRGGSPRRRSRCCAGGSKGAALRTGFAAADGADEIVTIDTEEQHSITAA